MFIIENIWSRCPSKFRLLHYTSNRRILHLSVPLNSDHVTMQSFGRLQLSCLHIHPCNQMSVANCTIVNSQMNHLVTWTRWRQGRKNVSPICKTVKITDLTGHLEGLQIVNINNIERRSQLICERFLETKRVIFRCSILCSLALN